MLWQAVHPSRGHTTLAKRHATAAAFTVAKRAYESAADRGLGYGVPLENIGGRAEFITFSLDGSATWNPLTWYSAMRGERAWSTLRPPLAEGYSAQENTAE